MFGDLLFGHDTAVCIVRLNLRRAAASTLPDDTFEHSSIIEYLCYTLHATRYTQNHE